MPKNLFEMSRAELDAEWEKERKKLEEKKEKEGLTQQEETYLYLAIFYTTKLEDGK